MTTILVERELLERLALPPASSSGWTEWNTAVAYEAARELRALLAEQPQAGAGQADERDILLAEARMVIDACLDECDLPSEIDWMAQRASKGRRIYTDDRALAAHQPAARQEQGDEVRRLREALAGLVALYEDDEGCRSLPQYKAARAALTHSQQGEEE